MQFTRDGKCKMKYRALVTSTLIASAFPLHGATANRPNIIYINADDLGVMDVGFDGRKEYNTPNLNKLASEGMVFTNAFSPAANCAPSRACCMSGQYTPRHGIYTVKSSSRGLVSLRKLIPIKNNTILPDENVTIAEALKTGGYKTIHLGKWHLGKNPCAQGFDINIGGDRTGSPVGGYFVPFRRGPMKRYNKEYPKGTHLSAILADQAIKFINQNKDKPFFMYLAFYSVHGPLKAVPEYIEKYKDSTNINPAYASMIEKMDNSIGKVLNEIERLGLKNNTLVLFTSDNGGVCKISKQTPYRAGKGSYFDGGIRVPLCVRWPGKVESNTKCDVPVIGIDFYPTFLAVAEVSLPKGKILDGVNLMPLLTQTGKIPDRALYWHFPVYLQAYAGKEDDSHDIYFRTRPGSVIKYGKWKLHQYFENNTIELYGTSRDIGERSNIASTMPEKAQELLAKLNAWRAEVHAPVPTQLNSEYNPNAKIVRKKKHKK